MTTGWRWSVAVWTFGATMAVSPNAIAQMTCDPCRVGVVLDGHWERNDEVRGVFEREVLDLTGDDFEISFPENKRLFGDFSLGSVASAVDQLIDDPEVDLMLTMGPVASTYIARLGAVPKPVVAIFVIDPEVQGMPIATDAQGERVSERRIARAALKPQVAVAGFGELIDGDRAASLGGGPQRLGIASASISQLLYSESALANVEIQDELQLSRAQQLEETRLDIALEAAVAYLDVLRAKTFEDIQRENLGATRSHLDLAQVRQEIGVARPAEVVRWENQIANNRRDVIDAIAQRNVAEIRLNRLLNRPLEEPFQTEETNLDDPGLRTSAAQLGPYIGDPFAFDIFRDFMTVESLGLAPELQQVDAVIRAQERALQAARRQFWSPTVLFEGDVSAVKTGGAGTRFDLGLPFPLELPMRNAFNWTLNVSASLPLFTGDRQLDN